MTALEEQVTRAFEQSRDEVYRYLLTFRLGPAQAQDATQEVFLRLYVALRAGNAIENTRAWLFRVAHNLGLDWRARDRSRPLDTNAATLLRDNQPDAVTSMIERERRLAVAEAWMNLSLQQQECLHLRSAGLKYREIAEAMGISISSVREFLARAVAKLQKAVYE